MATLITLDTQTKPAMTTLRDLTKQALILENASENPQSTQMQNVRATYLRACELWPAAMRIAAAIVANDNTFTAATLDGLVESNAP